MEYDLNGFEFINLSKYAKQVSADIPTQNDLKSTFIYDIAKTGYETQGYEAVVDDWQSYESECSDSISTNNPALNSYLQNTVFPAVQQYEQQVVAQYESGDADAVGNLAATIAAAAVQYCNDMKSTYSQ